MAWTIEVDTAPTANNPTIMSLAEFEGDIYGGSNEGTLLKLNTSTKKWEVVAAALSPVGSGLQGIYALAEFDGDLYAGTKIMQSGYGAHLFKWDKVSAWVDLGAFTIDAEVSNSCFSMLEYNGRLYMGGSVYEAGYGGNLFRLNSGKTGIELVCGDLYSQHTIKCLAEINGKIYAGTYPAGMLFKLNDAGNSWERVANTADVCSPTNGSIDTIVEYDGVIYGSGQSSGYILKLNEAGDAWEVFVSEATGGWGASISLFLVELYGRLYVYTTDGKMYLIALDGSSVTLVCDAVGMQSIYSTLIANSKLYGGTGGSGLLYSYYVEPLKISSKVSSSLACVLNDKAYLVGTKVADQSGAVKIVLTDFQGFTDGDGNKQYIDAFIST